MRKQDNRLLGDRTPAYVDRLTGAAELSIPANTWDRWVAEGILPKPCNAFPNGTPRWRWEDVDRKLSGKAKEDIDSEDTITEEELLRRSRNFGKFVRKKRRRSRFSVTDDDVS